MNCCWFTLISIFAVMSISRMRKKRARKSTKVFFGLPSGRASCSWRSRVASMGRGAPDSRPVLSWEMETARPFQYADGPPRVPLTTPPEMRLRCVRQARAAPATE